MDLHEITLLIYIVCTALMLLQVVFKKDKWDILLAIASGLVALQVVAEPDSANIAFATFGAIWILHLVVHLVRWFFGPD